MQKYKKFIAGTNVTCTVNGGHRVAATLYILERVCFSYVIVNILCKGNKHIMLIIVLS
jgi:hypothetical protein